MSPLLLLGVAVGGGVGAVLRFIVDSVIKARFGDRFPIGTLAINLSGSLVLGILAGLAGAGLPDDWHAMLGTGLLGGYTTFSAASVEVVRLFERRASGTAVVYGLGSLVASVALAGLGFALASHA